MFAFRPFPLINVYIDSVTENDTIITQINNENKYEVNFYFDYFNNKPISIESDKFDKSLNEICEEITDMASKNMKNYELLSFFKNTLINLSNYCLLFSNLNYNVNYLLIEKFKNEIFLFYLKIKLNLKIYINNENRTIQKSETVDKNIFYHSQFIATILILYFQTEFIYYHGKNRINHQVPNNKEREQCKSEEK